MNSDEAAAQRRRENERRMQEEKRNGLRRHFLQELRNAFEKEADCEVNNVVLPSDRRRAGITSNDVMRLAAEYDMRVKRVTLNVDAGTKPSDLIALLTELGAKHKGERNPNVSFLLTNGSLFLDGGETIEGISLYPDKSGRVAVFFDNSPVAIPEKKSPMQKRPRERRQRKRKAV